MVNLGVLVVEEADDGGGFLDISDLVSFPAERYDP